jgi:hypothetical protein
VARVSGVALAFSGRGVLVVGVEEKNGSLRVYLGHRGDGRYFIPHPDDRERIKREWASSFRQHLVIARDELVGVPIFTEVRG